MANDIVQTIAEARVDARSLSEFVFKPAGFKVERRLAPVVDTLQFYINRFNSLNGDFSSSVSVALSSLNNYVAEADGKVAYIEATVQDAINNTAIEGGVLADTFVTATANTAGSVPRTQRDKNSDYASLKDFGVVGDGVADDTLALGRALNSGKKLDWLDCDVLITDSISISLVQGSSVSWTASGAKLTYNGVHKEYLIQLTGININYDIDCDLTIDCDKSINKGLEILCQSANMTDSQISRLSIRKLKVKNIKRIKTFLGGDGINIRGGFSRITIGDGVEVSNSEMPAGQGISGSQGVSGITISHYGEEAYCPNVVVGGVKIEKIYSSDLSYTQDQDGLRYLTPTSTSGALLASSILIDSRAEFINCYGRAIKTQCQITTVNNISITRNEGNESKLGNGDIDCQYGRLDVSNVDYYYSNGYISTCVGVSSALGQSPAVFNVKDCTVHLDADTTLIKFAITYPRDGDIGTCYLGDIKIKGKIDCLVDFRVRGEGAKLSLTYNEFDGFVADSEYKALVLVKASGTATLRSADVLAIGNHNKANDGGIITKSGIPGFAMGATTDSSKNIGFDPSLSQINKMNKIGSMEGSGYIELMGRRAGATNVTEVFDINNANGALVMITMASTSQSYAFCYMCKGVLVAISKGDLVEVSLTEPETGDFRVWLQDSNTLCVKNTQHLPRAINVHVISG